MDPHGALLLVHAAATWAMVGLVWFVQVVHYPLFARVGVEGFVVYEREHIRRTNRVVVPTMLVEGGSTGLLLWVEPASPLVVTGAGLLAAIWLSTFAIQVPLHAKLERGFDPVAQRRLVTTSWFRTLVWSVRGVVALALLVP